MCMEHVTLGAKKVTWLVPARIKCKFLLSHTFSLVPSKNVTMNLFCRISFSKAIMTRGFENYMSTFSNVVLQFDS